MNIRMTFPVDTLMETLPALGNLTLAWDDDEAPAMHKRFAERSTKMLTKAFGDASGCHVDEDGVVTVTLLDDAELPESLSDLADECECPQVFWPDHLDDLGEVERAVAIICSVAWCHALEDLMSYVMEGVLVTAVMDAVGDWDERKARAVYAARLHGIIPDEPRMAVGGVPTLTLER